MRNLLDWRSPEIADEFAGHDNADFAQEFLRRNPDYQRDYQQTDDRIASDPTDERKETEGLARRWGMCFPLRSRRRSARCTCALGTVACRDDRHRRCRAACV